MQQRHVMGKAQAADGMAEAVADSLTDLTEPDLQAAAAYLATVPAISEKGDTHPAFDWGAPASSEAALRGESKKPQGAALYSGLCASCHGEAGTGTPDQFMPSLFHNSTVGAERPNNVVAVILNGVDREAGGRHAYMPAFSAGSYAQPLTDAQVADVATYVRTTFGPGGAVSAADVASTRKGGPPSPLLKLATFGVAGGALVVLAVLGWLGWKVFPRRRRAAR